MNDEKWKLLLRSVERQDPSYKSKPTEKKSSSRGKNKKPEKIVEKDCLDWAKKNSVFLHVVESKAVFSQAAGRYLRGQTESGLSDLIGNNTSGHSVWIELKAKDRRCTLSLIQHKFLSEKISQGCFAVVVDSADRLHEYYYTWLNNKNPKAYLTGLLPVPRAEKNQPIDPHLGF